MSQRALVITIACLALLALALRVVRLEERVPHTDEAINAWILGRVLAGDPFTFDPRDRHGPLLPAAGLVVATVLGRRSFADLDERTIRLAPALVGAAATGLFLLGQGLLPNGVLAGSAAFWAVSPLPLYYARYAIHETLLVAATLAFLLFLARAIRADVPRVRLAWAVGAGCAVGTMLAAKLSAAIPCASAAAALVFVGRGRVLRYARSVGLPLALAAVLTVTLAYSWGFTHLSGLRDLVFGLDAPLARAAGQGHEKGALYFAGVLATEPSGVFFLLAAAIGAFVAWRRGGELGRGLVIYAAIIVGVHSAIPYKTPWLALGLFLPLAALAAWTIAALVSAAWQRGHLMRAVAVIGIGSAAGLNAATDHRLVFSEPAAETNPYAYAHTSPDLRRLEPLVASLSVQDPLIAAYLEDAWPLPFLLRHQARVGYWQPGQTLPDAPDLLITTPDLVGSLGARFAAWRPHYFSQRPGVMLVALQAPTAEVAAP